MIKTSQRTPDSDLAGLIRRRHEAARVERARTIQALLRKLIGRPSKAPYWPSAALQPAVDSGR